jgi:chaperone modulatory protein CbpM
MAEPGDFVLHARLDVASLEAWVEEGWLAPRSEAGFSERDVARACLIRELREGLGVNDEGVAVVLDLLDQVHGLRLALRRVAAAVHDLPEPLRREAMIALLGREREGSER